MGLSPWEMHSVVLSYYVDEVAEVRLLSAITGEPIESSYERSIGLLYDVEDAEEQATQGQAAAEAMIGGPAL